MTDQSDGEATDLPSGWVMTTLGEVTTPSTLREIPPLGSPLPYLSMESVQRDTGKIIDFANAGKFKSSAPRVTPGFTLYGRLRPYLNKVVECPFDGYCSGEFIPFPPQKWLSHRFLLYRLLSPDFVAFSAGLDAGDRPRVKWSQIAAFSFALPPIEEQRRIVEAIDEKFSRLERAQSILADLPTRMDTLHKLLVSAALRGELTHRDTTEGSAAELVSHGDWFRRPDGPDSDPWNIPEEWIWSTIGSLFPVYVGSTPSRNNPANWIGDVSWVSSGEVKFNRITTTREKISESALGNRETRLHPPGTVMLAMIGEGKTRGQVAILDIPAGHNQNCASIRVSATRILPEYIYLVLKQRYEESRRSSAGGNQSALNKSKVQAMPVPVAPLAEQREIVEVFRKMESEADNCRIIVENALKRSKNFRRAVLRSAFNGNLVAQDPDDEPASELLARIKAERGAESRVTAERNRRTGGRRTESSTFSGSPAPVSTTNIPRQDAVQQTFEDLPQ